MGDIITYGLIVFFVGAIILAIWSDWHNEQRRRKEFEQMKALATSQSNPTVQTEKNKGTRDLLLDTLTKIGCQYQLGEGDDDRIYFPFQGENFIVDASNENIYIHIWDACWAQVELYDIDEVARIKRAINTSNLNSIVTTVFTIDEASSTLEVHSKTTIPFLPTMPHLEDYLRVTLNEFFRAHQVVGYEMHKMREQE